MVECNLAKVEVASSNLVSRSNLKINHPLRVVFCFWENTNFTDVEKMVIVYFQIGGALRVPLRDLTFLQL